MLFYLFTFCVWKIKRYLESENLNARFGVGVNMQGTVSGICQIQPGDCQGHGIQGCDSISDLCQAALLSTTVTGTGTGTRQHVKGPLVASCYSQDQVQILPRI